MRDSARTFVALVAQVGFTAFQLHEADFKAEHLEDAGYGCNDLRTGGYLAEEVKNVSFSASDFREAGYLAEDIKQRTQGPHFLLGQRALCTELPKPQLQATFRALQRPQSRCVRRLRQKRRRSRRLSLKA